MEVREPQSSDELKAGLETLLEAQRQALAAENERKQLEQERLLEAQKATIEAQQKSLYEKRRALAVEALLSKAGEIIQKMDNVILADQYLATEVAELSREIEVKLDHIHYVLGLLLEINRLRIQGVRTKADQEEMDRLLDEADKANFDLAETEETAIRKRLRVLNKTLNQLKEREAMYGINTPVDLLNEIGYTEERIEQAQAQLAALIGKLS